jgi:hypothetical protein
MNCKVDFEPIYQHLKQKKKKKKKNLRKLLLLSNLNKIPGEAIKWTHLFHSTYKKKTLEARREGKEQRAKSRERTFVITFVFYLEPLFVNIRRIIGDVIKPLAEDMQMMKRGMDVMSKCQLNSLKGRMDQLEIIPNKDGEVPNDSPKLCL